MILWKCANYERAVIKWMTYKIISFCVFVYLTVKKYTNTHVSKKVFISLWSIMIFMQWVLLTNKIFTTKIYGTEHYAELVLMSKKHKLGVEYFIVLKVMILHGLDTARFTLDCDIRYLKIYTWSIWHCSYVPGTQWRSA